MSGEPVKAAIAIGANMGDRRAIIESALVHLDMNEGVRVVARGPVIENDAVRTGSAEPGGAYLNTAVVVRTTLEPKDLMRLLHEIEEGHGRRRSKNEGGGPRTLDLDLILYGRRRVSGDDGLIVPHPRMHERRFVLEPLSAIAQDWLVPGMSKRVGRLLADVLAGENAGGVA